VAVKIPCSQCGTENALGRVFCSGCGLKLESANISQESLAKAQRPAKTVKLASRIVGILVAISAVVLLSFMHWPSPIDADEGTRRAGNTATRKLDLVDRQIKTGSLRLVSQNFTEKDVNGYFIFHGSKKRRLLDVAFHEGHFEARLVSSIGPITIGSFESPALRLSRKVRGRASASGIEITHGSIGHVPMIGPLKGIPAKAIRKAALAVCPHRELLAAAQGIKFREDAVELTLGPRR